MYGSGDKSVRHDRFPFHGFSFHYQQRDPNTFSFFFFFTIFRTCIYMYAVGIFIYVIKLDVLLARANPYIMHDARDLFVAIRSSLQEHKIQL